MDNEALAPHDPVALAAPRSSFGLPRASDGLPAQSTMTAVDPERTGVFTSLVTDDSDISGLVAYSIYKQNKLDWLQAFEAIKGRIPNEAELAAYIIGESTPRRLATYRHLAESTLAGNGPDVAGSGRAVTTRSAQPTAMPKPGLIVIYAVIAVLLIVGFWLAAHYTVSNH